MAKPTVTTEPKAVEALVDIVERAIPCRFPDRAPSLFDIVRTVNSASRC